MKLFYIGFLVLVAILLSALSVDLFVQIFRRRGQYPAKGEVTLEDVRNLIVKGEHVLAMRAYREVTGASLKETKEVIESIEKSLPSPSKGTEE